ncbi:MAG: ABC transporter ATP-binding protein [Rhodothermaceae bacterium]
MEQNNFAIQTKNLSFSYDKNESLIKGLNIEVPKGAVYGFLGPNGAGKTTTIRLLTGLLKPGAGEVLLFNDEDENLLKSYSRIGAMIEEPALYFHLTARENLEITALYRGVNKSRIDDVLEIVDLQNTGNKRVKQFSTGMKQRLGIALALLSDPELIILDEPTNGLDPKGMIEVRELITRLANEENKTIFLSSHLLNEIEKVCSHVGIIQNGELRFQGFTEDLHRSRDNNLIVEFEINDSAKTKDIFGKSEVKILDQFNGSVKISLEDKTKIPQLIDKLRQENIDIYQVKIKKENLEDLFLTLTEE